MKKKSADHGGEDSLGSPSNYKLDEHFDLRSQTPAPKRAEYFFNRSNGYH